MRTKEINGGYLQRSGVLYEITPHKAVTVQGFAGYAVSVMFLPGTAKLTITDDESRNINLLEAGCRWLVFYPENEYWALTVFYGADGEILEWYFDITKSFFIDENGIPCIDDLYLDLVLLPDGRTLTLDEDEFIDALSNEAISQDEFVFGYEKLETLKKSGLISVPVMSEFSAELLRFFDLGGTPCP